MLLAAKITLLAATKPASSIRAADHDVVCGHPGDPKSIQAETQGLRQENRRLRASDVAAYTKEAVWWQCPVSSSHAYQMRVAHRTLGKPGCPFCAGVRISPDNNLAARYPNIAKSWHPTRNLPLTPADVTPGVATVVWWRCFKSAKHIWQAVNFIVGFGKQETQVVRFVLIVVQGRKTIWQSDFQCSPKKGLDGY